MRVALSMARRLYVALGGRQLCALDGGRAGTAPPARGGDPITDL